MIVDGIVEPMELGHLPYKKRTFENYVGVRGYECMGKKKWRKEVAEVVSRLVAALEPEDVVLESTRNPGRWNVLNSSNT
jgi:polyphosphate glucokinase